MKRILSAIIALCAITAANAALRTINVGEFNELVVNDGINVVYSNAKDSVGLVAFDIERQYTSYIMAERSKGKLKIVLDPAAAALKTLPTVYVYSSYLYKAENSKDSTLTIRNVAPGAKVDITLQGNGKIIARNLDAVNICLRLLTGKGTIIASGKCDNLTVSNVGTGEIQADEVAAKNVKASLMGTGTIGCSASETLSVKGLGSGKVYYIGKPTITKSKLSNVKIVQLEGGNEEEAPVTNVTDDNDADNSEETDNGTGLLDLMELPDAASSAVDPDANVPQQRKPVKE